ncbi:CLUMA_CG017327, isoform A [Clunio marinus]|uniref:CLUMA_CG017327, isoform A n=1 Tax=Clunio marinus TaxID=568069 RepID=A0A1J1IYJ8_9DIPT|nr:CLUMA_CG017327, isoform A [Clunio marinus]
MSSKVNLDDIKQIPAEEFKEILHAWMNEKEITKELQKKLRKQLFTDFQKTELAKQLEMDKQKALFDSKDFVIDTLQAEHLYNQNNHFTLSVFFTETRHSTLLPNFEKDSMFRFEEDYIGNLIDLMGITKSDKITRRILNVYKSSTDSLLSIMLKELIISHNTTETGTVATQTETNNLQSEDLSFTSSKSKNKKKRRRRHHGLTSSDSKTNKSKKVKEIAVISQNLDKMSNNISIITNKLDDFKRHPSQDDSKAIIESVGTIMQQLNCCVINFERLCQDIRKVSEVSHKNYDEWMNELQNTENGRRFLRKLQKSFSRIMREEKDKLEKDFRRKVEREKLKLSKLYRSSAPKSIEKKPQNFPDTITKEINEIFENTCMMIKNVEKESELFEKSLEVDEQRKRTEAYKDPRSKTTATEVNLDDCLQIHSKESSSVQSDLRSYTSNSFEIDETHENK